MRFDLIQAAESDKDYLLQLRKLTMVEHLQRAGQFLTEQEHQLRLEDQYDCSYMVRHNGVTIGGIKYKASDDRVEIMQVQIHPEHQNKGYGKAILQQILALPGIKTVSLTVLKQNPAVNLYKKLGFKVTGEDCYEYHMQFQDGTVNLS